MTDRGAHVIDLAQLAAGFDDTGPVKIKADGIAAADSLYASYFDFNFENEYTDQRENASPAAPSCPVRSRLGSGFAIRHVSVVRGQRLIGRNLIESAG